MSTTKIVGMSVGVFVGLILLVFVLGGVGLGYYALYAPWQKKIERRIFEETKSYTHGMIMDLAKYKREHDSTTDPTERSAIREIVSQRFAEFDVNSIRPVELRRFLVTMRGY